MNLSLYTKLALGAGLLYWFLRYVYHELTIGAARRKIIKENGCKPINRYPTLDPFFGLDLLYKFFRSMKRHDMLERNATLFPKFGNTLHLRFLHLTATQTIEPEIVKNILALQFRDFELGENRRDSLGPLLGKGIFTTDGADWEHSRALLRPNFTRSQVGDLPTFERHVMHLIDAIPRNGDTVDLQELFFSLTIDSATEFLFGKSCDSLIAGRNGDSKSEFADAFNSAQEGVNRRDLRGPLSKIWPDRKFEHDLKVIREFIDYYVEEALAQRSAEKAESDRGRYIFLHELAKETQDPIQIRSESLHVLLAGRDTTASLLSNCWFVLARRPDIWAKLRAEIDELHGKPPTYQQLKDMRYLRYTLNESLRLHPVVPGNSRTAVRDTVMPIGGGSDGKSPCFVKKGTEWAWSTYAMHRRKDFYGEDAEEFRPERWEKLRPSWEYLPFNGGPRICIGQQYALTEASYTTVRLIQAFSAVEARDPEPWTEKILLTCCSFNGTKVSLTPA